MNALYSSFPWWLLALLHAALLTAALSVGFRIGRAAQRHRSSSSRADVATLTAALIGLVGLLLGFSFSMASTRFDRRKSSVVKEANAMATTYMRAGLLDEARSTRMHELLASYIERRIALYDVGVLEGSDAAKDTIAKTLELRRELGHTMVAAANVPGSPPAGTILALTTSMNQMFEAAGERDAANHDRVPDGVLVLLLLTTLAACLLVGLVGGQEGEAPVVPWLVFATSVVLVVATITDLDRPTNGLSRIGQEPIVRLLLDEVRGA
jgi:hypothetical protein